MMMMMMMMMMTILSLSFSDFASYPYFGHELFWGLFGDVIFWWDIHSIPFDIVSNELGGSN